MNRDHLTGADALLKQHNGFLSGRIDYRVVGSALKMCVKPLYAWLGRGSLS